MADLRKLARGQSCQIRAPGICNGDPETVVLCHVSPDGGMMGGKPPDVFGCWGCSDCHSAIDGRAYNLERDYRRLLALDAVMRTQAELVKMGVLKW